MDALSERSAKGAKMKVSGAAAALGAFTLIVLGAGTASADNCTGIKIKAIGKKESRLLSCSAKEAVKGTVGVESRGFSGARGWLSGGGASVAETPTGSELRSGAPAPGSSEAGGGSSMVDAAGLRATA